MQVLKIENDPNWGHSLIEILTICIKAILKQLFLTIKKFLKQFFSIINEKFLKFCRKDL
jgi:hypothetical protein